MIKGVVFDLDGTLIDVPIQYDWLFREFEKIMMTDDIHPLAKKISELDRTTKKRVFQVWDKAELEASKKVTAKEEGINFYRKNSNKPKALITLQGKAFTENVLQRFDLSFRLVITRENSLDRVEQLSMAIRKLGAPSKQVLFIGNTEEDSRAAEKVDCPFLRVNK